MVCIPCFIVPVLLIIWKKFIEPYLYPLIYKYYYGIEYKKDENKDNLINCDGGKCIFAGKKKIEGTSNADGVAEEKSSVEEKKDI